ncbi:hypothetical protein FA95DRAFT_1564397 [Auriscalpium vulgare]|uniref:Uncharacterized protein n=1 Tax=Auriscalpium vulgare TaxID=40419 RepID=A0ACB8REE0_9AGAM|nr:hypothetical protein FA95DRAFT_1564397 [Auriscalpium vulgare]
MLSLSLTLLTICSSVAGHSTSKPLFAELSFDGFSSVTLATQFDRLDDLLYLSSTPFAIDELAQVAASAQHFIFLVNSSEDANFNERWLQDMMSLVVHDVEDIVADVSDLSKSVYAFGERVLRAGEELERAIQKKSDMTCGRLFSFLQPYSPFQLFSRRCDYRRQADHAFVILAQTLQWSSRDLLDRIPILNTSLTNLAAFVGSISHDVGSSIPTLAIPPPSNDSSIFPEFRLRNLPDLVRMKHHVLTTSWFANRIYLDIIDLVMAPIPLAGTHMYAAEEHAVVAGLELVKGRLGTGGPTVFRARPA